MEEVTPESKDGRRVLKIATDLAVSECIQAHRDEILARVKELLLTPEKILGVVGGEKAE